MKFNDMTNAEKIEYKKNVIKDFKDHGMDDQEALVNYVFCVNPDPLKWLEYKYCIGENDALKLKEDGLKKYKENGGECGCQGVEPAEKIVKKHICKCRKPVIPE